MTLTPIAEVNLEQSVYALFAAWLGSFFDGGSHAVGTNAPVIFPAAALGFAQSAMPQPLNPTPGSQATGPQTTAVGITLVLAGNVGRVSRRWGLAGGLRQRLLYKKVRLNFWVRSATADSAARAACLSAGQLLEAILANEASTYPLSQNGVLRLRPGSPQPVADTAFILRLVTCEATLRYAVRTQ